MRVVILFFGKAAAAVLLRGPLSSFSDSNLWPLAQTIPSYARMDSKGVYCY